VTIHAAYGSSKDIQVYASVGLKPDEIFCIGKASKKLQDKATVSLIKFFVNYLQFFLIDFWLMVTVDADRWVFGSPSRVDSSRGISTGARQRTDGHSSSLFQFAGADGRAGNAPQQVHHAVDSVCRSESTGVATTQLRQCAIHSAILLQDAGTFAQRRQGQFFAQGQPQRQTARIFRAILIAPYILLILP
jgi:hypothetical protein